MSSGRVRGGISSRATSMSHSMRQLYILLFLVTHKNHRRSFIGRKISLIYQHDDAILSCLSSTAAPAAVWRTECPKQSDGGATAMNIVDQIPSNTPNTPKIPWCVRVPSGKGTSASVRHFAQEISFVKVFLLFFSQLLWCFRIARRRTARGRTMVNYRSHTEPHPEL